MKKVNLNEKEQQEVEARKVESNKPERHPLNKAFKGSLEMTVPEFKEWLVEKFGKTSKGKEITANYTHLCVNYGRLPKEFGGWVITHKIYHGIKIITITNELFDFNQGNKGKTKKDGTLRAKKLIKT